MIREYNYYITTNRFSEIAEELDAVVRRYAQTMSIGMGDVETSAARENARKLCSEHLIKSGLRNKEESFINIDAEFFDGGELVENNLNKFIKNILKAHGYQKILWEYMGTTGLMTEISKSSMERDGFKYENYLPAELRIKRNEKNTGGITRNFNRLKDESGFDWGKGYDPNDFIEKKGWFSDYDENGIWTKFVTDGEKTQAEKKNSNSKKYTVRLIKTATGCILYDPDMTLLDPVLLWYLTQEDEIYGGEESDTAKTIEEIRARMLRLGVDKITEIACGNTKENHPTETGGIRETEETILSQYKKILGTSAEKNVILITTEQAEKKSAENIGLEKRAVIEKESSLLQKKIDTIIKVSPKISSEKIEQVLQTGKIEIALDIMEKDDAESAGIEEEEYETFIAYAAELDGKKREDYKHVCAVLSSRWNEYKHCGYSRGQCMKLLYDFIKKGKENDFNYEISLKQVLDTNHKKDPKAVFDSEFVEKAIKEYLPQENQAAAMEYIFSLPEQDVSVKQNVYKILAAAVKNYMTIRMSTGMSIRELFDYAIKKSGGKIPKSSYSPPLVGYINARAKVPEENDATGSKHIYFESKVSDLYAELMTKPLPEKEVSLVSLQKVFERSFNRKTKKLIKIGFDVTKEPAAMDVDNKNNVFYDIGTEQQINPVVFALLKKIYIDNEENKKRIIEIAALTNTKKEFINSLKKEFQLEYNFTDEIAREVYAFANPAINTEFLNECVQELEERAEQIISKADYRSLQSAEIKPVFAQVSRRKFENTDNINGIVPPAGYSFMNGKSNSNGELEKISRVYVQRKSEGNVPENKTVNYKKAAELEDAIFSIKEKEAVSVLINKLTSAEKIELLYAADEDWNNITPLLIKEYIWRKKSGRSVKTLLKEVRVYEKLSSVPLPDLKKFLTSSAVNGMSKKVAFDDDTLNFSSVLSQHTAASHSHTVLNNIPVVKLTKEDRTHFYQTYGLKTEGLSPVIKAYIKSGAWKNNKTFGQATITVVNDESGNGNSVGFSETNRNYSNEMLQGNNAGRKPAAAVKIPQFKKVRNLLEENAVNPAANAEFANNVGKTGASGHSDLHLSDPLKESLLHIAAERSGKSQEKTKLERINANYEHDRAVLAKTDPAFMAKNRFWDVGHADGEGETLENTIVKNIINKGTTEQLLKLDTKRYMGDI